MKKLFFAVILFCSCTTSFSQGVVRSTIGTAGGVFESNNLIVEESVGQASVIGSVNRNAVSIRQGFIQPPVSVLETQFDEGSLNARLFPNPVESKVNILFSDDINGEVTLLLYDMLGREVLNSKRTAAQNMSLDMSALPSASYVLLISTKGKQLKATLLKR